MSSQATQHFAALALPVSAFQLTTLGCWDFIHLTHCLSPNLSTRDSLSLVWDFPWKTGTVWREQDFLHVLLPHSFPPPPHLPLPHTHTCPSPAWCRRLPPLPTPTTCLPLLPSLPVAFRQWKGATNEAGRRGRGRRAGRQRCLQPTFTAYHRCHRCHYTTPPLPTPTYTHACLPTAYHPQFSTTLQTCRLPAATLSPAAHAAPPARLFSCLHLTVLRIHYTPATPASARTCLPRLPRIYLHTLTAPLP